MTQKGVTVKEIQDLDRIAIEKYGVPSIALMENAGRLVTQEVLRHLPKQHQPRVCIFCGLGNNAGDGFVVARHLINRGVNTKIFLIGQPGKLKNDAAVNYRILKNCKYAIKSIHGIDKSIEQQIAKADVIVDAIFGVGLNREVSDPFASIIRALNRSKKRIVSVDIPSGLDGTTGKIYGVCIRAYKTVTFSFVKKGFLKGQGPRHVGKVVVVDIGIPEELKNKISG